MMAQVSAKAESFHNEIRRKQKERLFKKIRKENQERTLFRATQLQKIHKMLAQLQGCANTLEQLHQNENSIVLFLSHLRRIEDIPTGHVLDDVMNFVVMLSDMILNQTAMDTEESEFIDNPYTSEAEGLFAPIIDKIYNVLFNLLAEKDEVVLEYLEPIEHLLKYRPYIDCFYNMLLNSLLTHSKKQELFQIFLQHLENYPNLYLHKLHKYTPIVYQALLQDPPLLTSKQLHLPVIKLLLRQFSLLQFAAVLEEIDKDDYRTYACSILEQLTYHDRSNCQLLLGQCPDAEYLWKDITEKMKGLRSQLKRNAKNGVELKDHLIHALKLVTNITSIKETAQVLKDSQPVLWLHLLQIYCKLPEADGGLPILAQQVMTPICNIICSPPSCYDFLMYGQQQKPQKNQAFSQQDDNEEEQIITNRNFPHYLKDRSNINNRGHQMRNQTESSPFMIQILNQLFEQYFTNHGIRTQCFYLFNNVIAIITQEIKLHHQENPIHSELHILLTVIDGSNNLIYELMRGQHKDDRILKGFLKNITFLAQELGEEFNKRCRLVRDPDFVRKVQEIADDGESGRLYCTYSKQTQQYAHHLCDALRIQE